MGFLFLLVEKRCRDASVAAYRWTLGSRHPHDDICDLYAKADLYGLGKGVFPKDKAPQLPAHPHCLCHYAPVYQSELAGKKEKDNIQAGGAKFIKGLKTGQRERLLGVKGSRAYLEDSDWTKHARGWSWPKPDVKSRIILPDSLKDAIMRKAKDNLKFDLQLFAESDMKNQTSKSLKKGIRSYQKMIAKHEAKIADPAAYDVDWAKKDEGLRQGLVWHWQKEINTAKASMERRIEELKKRGDYNEREINARGD